MLKRATDVNKAKHRGLLHAATSCHLDHCRGDAVVAKVGKLEVEVFEIIFNDRKDVAKRVCNVRHLPS